MEGDALRVALAPESMLKVRIFAISVSQLTVQVRHWFCKRSGTGNGVIGDARLVLQVDN
jgi:hypothetical protein